ncbi:hypothetical protein Tco_0407387 [Tanacetum coccineum]
MCPSSVVYYPSRAKDPALFFIRILSVLCVFFVYDFCEVEGLALLSPKSTSWEQFGTNIASALDFIQVFLSMLIERGSNETLEFLLSKFSKDAQGTAKAQGNDADQGAAEFTISHMIILQDASQTLTDGCWVNLFCDLYAFKRGEKNTVRWLRTITWSICHACWGRMSANRVREARRRNGRKKLRRRLVSSVKLGRNKDESNLSEEHHDQDDHHRTAFVYEDVDATAFVTPD